MNSTLIIKTTQPLNNQNLQDLQELLAWQDAEIKLDNGLYDYELSSGYIYTLSVEDNEITVAWINQRP